MVISSSLDRARDALDSGDLEAARQALARASCFIEAAPDDGARLALLEAQLARRDGALLEAEAFAEVAARRLSRMSPPDLVLGVSHFRADLALGRGAYERARVLLRAGLADRSVPISPTWRVTFLRSLGAVETRLGRPTAGAEAYRQALTLLPSPAQPNLEASLYSNLAMALAMTGEEPAALRAADRARALRSAPEVPVRDRANTAALWALLHHGPTADPLWDEALALSGRSGDTALHTEIRLRAGLHYLDSGRLERADALIALGRAEARRLLRQEPTLVGLAHEVGGASAFACGDTAVARREWNAARASFVEINAAYHVARMDALLAELELARGTQRAFEDRWHLAVEAAIRGRFRLPARFDVLASAVVTPTPATDRYARRIGMTAVPLERGVVIHREQGRVDGFGQRAHLGADSVTFRALVVIARSGPRGVSPGKLCQTLWPNEAATPNELLARLRFQVHRLRQHLGGQDEAILCIRAGRTADTRYRWNAAVPIVWTGRGRKPARRTEP